MLLNYRIILLGLSTASSVLCDSPEYYDHGVSISDPIFTREHESSSSPILHPSSDIEMTTWPEDNEDTIVSINDVQHDHDSHSDTLPAAQTATNSSTKSTTHASADSLPDAWVVVDDLDDDMFMSLSTPLFLATHERFGKSTASATPPSSMTLSVVPSTSVSNPVKAALDWLTSPSNSTRPSGKGATLTSSTDSTSPDPIPTTTISTKTTDPVKAALDWLTLGLDDMGAIAATTTDLKHSSIVSGILSGLEATHTSAATANRLRVGFW